MDQQVPLVLGADLSPFETLISQLMSSANEQRSQAEALFNLCRERHPDTLVLKLVEVLQSSQSLDIRAMSAVLLRGQLESCVWTRLNPDTQSSIKPILLSAVQREETQSLSKKLCHAISELASHLLPDDAWQELLPFLFHGVESISLRLRESCLLILSQLAQYNGEMLLPYVSSLYSVFLNSLSQSVSPDVLIAAFGALVNFVPWLLYTIYRRSFRPHLGWWKYVNELRWFEHLVAAMMRTLSKALASGNEANAQEALELLIELAGTHPRVFQCCLTRVVGSILEIADDDLLEEPTRHLALEFVITLAESGKTEWRMRTAVVRVMSVFMSDLFDVLMKMLLDIEDAPDEDAGESNNYTVGQECLYRLSIALGGKTIVPVALKLLPRYVGAPEWQKRHAALVTLAQIAKGCAKVMDQDFNLKLVVSMVISTIPTIFISIEDPNPRVCRAVKNAMYQLSKYLVPNFRICYHHQAYAASGGQNFCSLSLTPYLDKVVKELPLRLQDLYGDLKQLVSMPNLCKDQSSRDRAAIIDVVSQLFAVLGPYLKYYSCGQIYHDLLVLLNDIQSPSVQLFCSTVKILLREGRLRLNP